MSGASSQCQSFSCGAAEETGAAPQHHHNQQQQPQQQHQPQTLEGQASGASSAAAGAGGGGGASGGPPARSRLGAGPANASTTSSQGSVLGFPAAPPAAWSTVCDNGAHAHRSTGGAVGAPPPKAATLGSGTVAVTVAAMASTAAREVSEVEAIEDDASVAAAAVAATGMSPRGGNGTLEITSASEASVEDASPQHISPTQAAWAAAVSLSSKWFGRGSKTGTGAQAQQA